MITVNSYALTPTIFPDGTSQIWKLPTEIICAEDLTIDWRFEAEREIFDLFSLRALLPLAKMHLYIPFLPYGRQDKIVANHNTFNLRVFGELLGRLNASHVTTLDAHNPQLAAAYGIKNIPIRHTHLNLIDDLKPDSLVFPDQGAANRYYHEKIPQIIFDKVRDSASGAITGHRVAATINTLRGHQPLHYLIVDDICDGGATFISVAKELRTRIPVSMAPLKISLFVTHGIFSKGRNHLYENGIDQIFTTDSLPRNRGIEGVIKV